MNSTVIKIRGLTPLLMHNGQLSDPLCAATQALAKLTAKKSKTLDDHRALSECEWRGSLYVNASGAPCLPGEVIEAAFVDGAKTQRLGLVAKGGIVCPEDYALEYDGPRTVDGLWDDGGYIKRASVRVKNNRVIRTRPIFPVWGCTVSVLWDPALIKSEDQLIDIAVAAGTRGIGDWRPKFGRFDVLQ
jgi:hypothetical protein